jgi:hypothetical protein
LAIRAFGVAGGSSSVKLINGDYDRTIGDHAQAIKLKSDNVDAYSPILTPRRQNKILLLFALLRRVLTWRLKFWLRRQEPRLLKYGGYTVLPQPRKMEDWMRLIKLQCTGLGITFEMIRDFLTGKRSIEAIEQELVDQKRLAKTGQLASVVQTKWPYVEKFMKKHKLTSEALLRLYETTEVNVEETKIHCPEVSPNPFTGEAEIRYKVARAGQVKVHIFAENGRLIKTLVDAKYAVGEFGVKWDGTNGEERPVAPGIYFVQADTPSYVASTQFEKVNSDWRTETR